VSIGNRLIKEINAVGNIEVKKLVMSDKWRMPESRHWVQTGAGLIVSFLVQIASPAIRLFRFSHAFFDVLGLISMHLSMYLSKGRFIYSSGKL